MWLHFPNCTNLANNFFIDVISSNTKENSPTLFNLWPMNSTVSFQKWDVAPYCWNHVPFRWRIDNLSQKKSPDDREYQKIRNLEWLVDLKIGCIKKYIIILELIELLERGTFLEYVMLWFHQVKLVVNVLGYSTTHARGKQILSCHRPLRIYFPTHFFFNFHGITWLTFFNPSFNNLYIQTSMLSIKFSRNFIYSSFS